MRAVSAIIRHRNFDSNTYNHDIALLKLRKTVEFNKNIRPVCLPSSEADPAGQSSNHFIQLQTESAEIAWDEKLKVLPQSKSYDTRQSLYLSPLSVHLAVAHILFNQQLEYFVGKTGIAVGWGRTSEGGALPAVVQHVQVPILTLNQCRSMKYRSSRITPNMVSGNLCFSNVRWFTVKMCDHVLQLCAGKGKQDSCQGDSGGPLLIETNDKYEIVGRFFLSLSLNFPPNENLF